MFEKMLNRKSLLLILLLSISLKPIAQPTCNWAYIPTSTSFSQNAISCVATDNSGNIIEVGKLTGRADMDPGNGPADTSFTTRFYNHYISKSSSSGQLLWIHYFEDNSQLVFFEFSGLKINSNNEIIVAGNFYGKIDFDLSSAEVDTLRSHFPTYPDYFIAKYDSAGNHQWALNIGEAAAVGISSKAIAVLPSNNILVVANPSAVTDVDPSSAIHTTTGFNANLICYDTDGNYIWNNSITLPNSYGIPNASLDYDSFGNSFLFSVGYYELTLTKFDSSGILLWSKTIGDFSTGGRVDPQSVLVDKANGDFYVAGAFEGSVDFDPGAANIINTCTQALYADGFIAKYDQNMNPIWVNPYSGKVAFGNYSLVYNGAEILAVGNLEGTIDFGNGVSLSSTGNYNPFYIKINAAGMAQEGYTLSGYGIYNTITQLNNYAFVMTGYIVSGTDMDPSSASLVLSPPSTSFFTAVYQIPNPTAIAEVESNTKMDELAFPNPFENNLALRTTAFDVNSDFKIRDLSGRIIYEAQNKAPQTSVNINTLNWQKGIYFLQINGQNFKLVKQ